ncbi:glycosyltransferase family 4 protein [Arthrobacter sp. MI7-26]|uniref:glycosyltransferase family 4 protein n=1 Tax=Arthrobacter sp. MI7-26 TaxID=2993653 RepID=UPI00224983F7|nr:glycosyltransferase family 4 protein [Arthrobacter sp. MI7-26]MCX2750281.1 glycosyltransferase family 4 protein [Arthrobacter sp. MI7-26]
MIIKFWHPNWHAMMARFLLLAQRNSTLVPTRLKRRMRGMLGRAITADIAIVEDWSRPLVDGPDAVPVRWPEPERDEDREAGSGRRPRDNRGTEIRCLLATESLDAGGMDEVVAFLARGLPQFGLRVAVLHAPIDTSSTPGRLGRVLREEGVEVVDLDRENCGTWIRNWRPDVLSVHGAPEWVLTAAAACSVPTIETLHGMHNQFNAAPSEVASRRELLAGLVSVSEMVRKQYLAIDDQCDPDSVVTIPNGLQAQRQQTMPREQARQMMGLSDEHLFVSLSRHCVQKNTYGLASAFSRVADAVPEAHLLICGRPDDTAYAGQVAGLKSKMRHGGRLHLRDHSPHPGVLLSAADGFVLDSFFEGWALSSMEALIAGIPVIVSEVGGAREQLADRPEWGLLVANPLGNPLEVDWDSMTAARFRRQSNQEELVEAMVSFARDHTWGLSRPSLASDAAERFDGDLCLQRHAHVLKAAAAGEPIALTRILGRADR